MRRCDHDTDSIQFDLLHWKEKKKSIKNKKKSNLRLLLLSARVSDSIEDAVSSITQ